MRLARRDLPYKIADDQQPDHREVRSPESCLIYLFLYTELCRALWIQQIGTEYEPILLFNRQRAAVVGEARKIDSSQGTLLSEFVFMLMQKPFCLP